MTSLKGVAPTMDIGIGLPGHARWADGRTLVEWARRAEARGFSTLSVSDFDRIGCHKLIFVGNDPDPGQVDLLADAIGL
jgi:hypothetical protein